MYGSFPTHSHEPLSETQGKHQQAVTMKPSTRTFMKEQVLIVILKTLGCLHSSIPSACHHELLI